MEHGALLAEVPAETPSEVRSAPRAARGEGLVSDHENYSSDFSAEVGRQAAIEAIKDAHCFQLFAVDEKGCRVITNPQDGTPEERAAMAEALLNECAMLLQRAKDGGLLP
jgi:hypothetical protein